MHQNQNSMTFHSSNAVDYLDVPEIKEVMAATKNCLNCGIRLPRGRGYKRNTGYCSLRCYYEKPPKMMWAELVYKKPIRDLMVEMLNKSSDEAVAGMLDITKQTLYRWMKNHSIKRVIRYE